MAEAAVEPGRNHRFFCHRCNIEFEDIIQNDTCPYCATGFIEHLDGNASSSQLHGLEDRDYSDAEMSTLDDVGGMDDSILDESLEGSNTNFNELPPMLNDLAFLMTGGRASSAGPRPPLPDGRHETLMEQLVWMIGGGRPGTGAVTAGAPFVLVGSPGDYVFGGEGLDAVVTQLLGQLENTGPAPLSTDQIATIPSEVITADQVKTNMSCSVCWDTFTLGESVSKLECSHIFHPACITPWLQLHATCPICRHSLAPPGPAPPPLAPRPPVDTTSDSSVAESGVQPSISRVVVRRLPALRRRVPVGSDSSSVTSTGSSHSVTSGVAGLNAWAQVTSTISALGLDTSTSEHNSSDRYMDIDFD